MKYRPPWSKDCGFCIKANSMYEDGDRSGAEEYIAEHEACVLCFVLVGDGHTDATVDRRGRCRTCEPRAVPA